MSVPPVGADWGIGVARGPIGAPVQIVDLDVGAELAQPAGHVGLVPASEDGAVTCCQGAMVSGPRQEGFVSLLSERWCSAKLDAAESDWLQPGWNADNGGNEKERF